MQVQYDHSTHTDEEHAFFKLCSTKLHRSIFQIWVLCTCLNTNQHKQYQGRRAKGSSGSSNHQPACRRTAQPELSWEGLTSAVKSFLVKGALNTLSSCPSTQWKSCRLRKDCVIICVVVSCFFFFVCLAL